MLLIDPPEIECPDLDAVDVSGVRQLDEGESSLSLNGDSGVLDEIAIVQ
jgi:hypothetical protein